MVDSKKREELIYLLSTISNHFNYLKDDICSPYGLTNAQSELLLDIYHNPNECRVTDICKRLHRSTNVISPLIDRLVLKGYLFKEKDKVDTRVTNVKITEKSKRLVDDIVQDITDYSVPCFEGITDEQANLVYSYFKTILEVMKK